MSARPFGAAAALAVALLVTPATAVATTSDGPPPLPEGGVSEQQLRRSVTVFSAADHVQAFATERLVRSLGEEVTTTGGETTISLSTDLLFAENSWELPANAPGRIAELVADVPDGAAVAVVGHTDTQQPVGQDFDNQELSERRAEAVAAALRDARPDLRLEVSGVGDTDPAVTPDPADPATHATNRRVEVTFAG